MHVAVDREEVTVGGDEVSQQREEVVGQLGLCDHAPAMAVVVKAHHLRTVGLEGEGEGGGGKGEGGKGEGGDVKRS